jgi:parvulin-like peptidyl-prolyl isomerase
MKKILSLLLLGAMLLTVASCAAKTSSKAPETPSAPTPAGPTASGGGSEEWMADLPDDPKYGQTLLKIGDYEVSYGVYRHYYQLLAKQMMGQDAEYFTKNPEKLEELRKQTLEQCTITASYFNLAAKAGIALPEQGVVDKAFADYMTEYKDLFPLYYGLSMKDYMIANGLTLSSYKTFYMIDTYLAAPIYVYLSDEKNGMVDLSNEALEEVLKDWRAVKHILVGYNDNLKPDEALALASDLRDRILAGEDMDSLMKQYSNDYQTNGQNVYTFTYDQMVKEFEDMAFSMEVGAVSEPVKSTYGYHVIMRLEIDKESFKKKEFTEAAVNKAFFAYGSSLAVKEYEALGALTHEELMK